MTGTSSAAGTDEGPRLDRAVHALHAWYRANARDLPWRRTRDPYAVWISEVMLQQTRTATVLPYYERWLARFADISALAASDIQDVLKLWEGLGYYSRARKLHEAAGILVTRHDGRIPNDPEAFRALPGVGAYTTAAVMSIVFGRDLAAVDGNVRRVLARLAALDGDPSRPPVAKAVEALAARLLPPGTAALHNQAVMELGALVCTPRAPACARCPLEPACHARAEGIPEAYPHKVPKPPVPHVDVAVGVLVEDGRVFINRRPYDGLLGGLWEFPGGKVEPGETVEQAVARELYEEFGLHVDVGDPLPAVRHAYTHYRVTLHPHLCRYRGMADGVGEGMAWRWVNPESLDDYPMPKANHAIVASLREHLSREPLSREPLSREPLPGGRPTRGRPA